MDAGLAAAAVGLDLSSAAHGGTDEALLFPANTTCCAVMLAGIDVNRSFEEMFEILDSLIEEAEETDEDVLRTLLEINIHVPSEIRPLLVNEAQESGESIIDYLYRLYDWLSESQEEDMEENADDTNHRHHEREFDTEGSTLPTPVDAGDEKPQGCEHGESMSSTNSSAQMTLDTEELTSRLGACTK